MSDTQMELIRENMSLRKEIFRLTKELEKEKKRALATSQNTEFLALYRDLKFNADRRLIDLRDYLTYLSKEITITGLMDNITHKVQKLFKASAVRLWYPDIFNLRKLSSFDKENLSVELQDYLNSETRVGSSSFENILGEKTILEKINLTGESHCLDLGSYEMSLFKNVSQVHIGLLVNHYNEFLGILVCECENDQAFINDKEFFEVVVNFSSILYSDYITKYRLAVVTKQIEFALVRDGLTGLYNRNRWDEDCKKELTEPLVVAIFDGDYFKKINDTYSHNVGDGVIEELGRLFQEAVIPINGTIYRFMGDEFILTSSFSALEVLEVLEGFRKKIQEHEFIVGPNGEVAKLTITVGMVSDVWNLQNGMLWADYYQNLGKKNGRNRIERGVYKDEVPVYEKHKDPNRYGGDVINA